MDHTNYLTYDGEIIEPEGPKWVASDGQRYGVYSTLLGDYLILPLAAVTVRTVQAV